MYRMEIYRDYVITDNGEDIVKSFGVAYQSLINQLGKNLINRLLEITNSPIYIESDRKNKEIKMILFDNVHITMLESGCYYDELCYITENELKELLEILQLINSNYQKLFYNIISLR